jgi:hypothetical protein
MIVLSFDMYGKRERYASNDTMPSIITDFILSVPGYVVVVSNRFTLDP